MLKTKTLEKYFNGKLYEKSEKEISSLCFDSRECKKGSAYFAFIGTVLDGNNYIDEAIKKGSVLVVANTLPENINPDVSYYITDENIRVVYSKLSSIFFDKPSEKLKIIGLTGTDGKSSTAYFTYQLLKALNKKVGLLSTVYIDDGNELEFSPFRQSTPDSYPLNSFLNDCVNNDLEYLVLEATSHALSYEFSRLEGIEFLSSIFTNITSEHLEFHKTHDNYVQAKCNLIDKTKNNVFAYETNREYKAIKERAKDKLITLPVPTIVDSNINGLSFIKDEKEYILPFGQGYQLENAYSAAVLVSSILELSLDTTLTLLKDLKGVSGRFELVENDLGLNLVIDFAHTANSYENLFSFVRKVRPIGRFIAVFGSGGNRDIDKRSKMGEIAEKYCASIIITEEDPRTEGCNAIAQDIASGIKNKGKIFVINKREEAISFAIELANEEDTVFFLGKGHENSIQGKKSSRPYNERKAIEEVLDEWTY